MKNRGHEPRWMKERGRRRPMRNHRNGLRGPKEKVFHAIKGGDLSSLKILFRVRKKLSDLRDDFGRSPSDFAAYCGHLDLLKYLIEEADCSPNTLLCSGFLFSRESHGDSPLHYAARQGHLKVMIYLIEECKCDPSVRNNKDGTPLHYASGNGHLGVVIYLIEKWGCDPWVKDNKGNTPLHATSFGGHLQVVDYLIRLKPKKLEIEMKNNNGATPLHVAASGGCLNLVILFIEENFTPDLNDHKGNNLLHYAALGGCQEVVTYLRTKTKLNVMTKNDEGDSLLHLASGQSHLNLVRDLILVLGFKPAVKNNKGNSSLHCAIKGGHLKIVEYFCGEDFVELKGKLNEENYEGNSPLHLAAIHGRLSVLKFMVEKGRFDYNMENKNGSNLLNLAAGNGHLDVVKYLSSDLELAMVDSAGNNPFKCAVVSGHQSIVEHLLVDLKVPTMPIRKGYSQRMPRLQPKFLLHLAVKSGQLKIVRYLVEKIKYDPNKKDDKGNIPLYYAVKRDRLEIVSYLIEEAKIDLTAETVMDCLFWCEGTSTSLSSTFISCITASAHGQLPLQQLCKKLRAMDPPKKRAQWHSDSSTHYSILYRWCIRYLDACPEVPFKLNVRLTSIRGFSKYKNLLYALLDLHIIADFFFMRGDLWRAAITIAVVTRADTSNFEKDVSLADLKDEDLRFFLDLFEVNQPDLTDSYKGFYKQCRDQKTFRKLCRESRHRTHKNVHYENQTDELLKDITKLTARNPIEYCKFLSEEALNKSQKNTEKFEALLMLRVLIKRCVLPSKFESGWFSNPITTLISDLKKFCVNPARQTSDWAPINEALVQLAEYYDSCLQNMKEQRVRLQGLDFRYHLLTKSAKDTLFGEKLNESGSHTAQPIGEVVYKFYPYAPGVEFTADSLNKIVTGAGSPPTRLLKVIDENQCHHPIIASKKIVGMELEFILIQHPKLIYKINPTNFSKMFVSGLLINHQDGKPDNFMGEVVVNDECDDMELFISCVDNDISFAYPFIVGKKQKEPLVDVRNVLYFFPQMDDFIGEEFRTQFLKRNPASIVMEWLASLVEQNKKYKELLDLKYFTLEEFEGLLAKKFKFNYGDYEAYKVFNTGRIEGNRMLGLRLPIKLVENIATKIHSKILKIRSLLQSNPRITHRDIFKDIQPKLSKAYSERQELIAKNFPRLDKIERIRPCIYSFYKDAEQYARVEKVCPEYLTHEVIKRHVTRGDTQPFTAVVQCLRSFRAFERDRIESVISEAERWIEQLDFTPMDIEAEALVLVELREKLNFITCLTLRGTQTLDCIRLLTYLKSFKALKYLRLSGCQGIDDSALRSVLRGFPNVVIYLDFSSEEKTGALYPKLIKQYPGRLVQANFKSLLTLSRHIIFFGCLKKTPLMAARKCYEKEIRRKIQFWLHRQVLEAQDPANNHYNSNITRAHQK